MRIFIIAIFLSLSFMQCEYDIGDINEDNILDVQDIIAFVNFILYEDAPVSFESYDLNSDSIVNIIDIIDLVNRILHYLPDINHIHEINYNFQDLELIWNATNDSGFNSYNIYYSNIISTDEILIYTTSEILDTSIVIENFILNEQNWFKIGTVDFMGCELVSEEVLYELPHKTYDIDSDGNVINHSFEINVDDSTA